MTADYRCRLVTTAAGLRELAADWDRLANAHPRPEVFYTWAWHAACQDAWGDQRQLCTPVVTRGDTVVAILPLAETGGTLQFLGLPPADYCDLLCADAAPAEVLLAALVRLHEAGHRRAAFVRLPAGALMLVAAAGLPERWRQRLWQRPGDPCPALVFESADTLAPILAKKSLRRHERALANLGALSFARLQDRASARARLPELYRQHRTRRIIAGDRSLFLDERHRRFYEALVDRLDPAASLHFTVLQSGDRDAALHFGFQSGRRLTWYKPTIDVDLWDVGPGEVLLKELLALCGAQDLVELDFTRGDEEFKQRFANHNRQNVELWLVRPGLAGRWTRARYAAAAALRRRPLPRAAAQRLATFGAELRGAVRRHGVLGTGGKLAARWWRRGVRAHDEVLVFHRARSAPPAGPPAVAELRIERGRLSGLAECAIEHPDHFDAHRLRQARQRLKSGDALFLAWRGPALAHVAWRGTRSEILATSELGDQPRLELPRPGTVIYDCWTPPAMRGQGVYPAVVAALAAGAEAEDVWIYCHAQNRASARGIEKAGFTLSHRMARVKWLGRTTSTSVRRC